MRGYGLVDVDLTTHPDLTPYMPQMLYFVEDIRRRPVDEVLREAEALPPALALMMALSRTLGPGRSLQAVFNLCKPQILRVLRISAEALWQFIRYIEAVRRHQDVHAALIQMVHDASAEEQEAAPPA